MNTKKITNFSIYLLSLLVLLSCKQQNKKNVKNPYIKTHLIRSSNQNRQVVITGISDDTRAFKYFNLLGLKYSTINNTKDSLLINSFNHLYIKSVPLKQPQFVNLIAFGKTIFNTTLFVSPNDSISLKIKNKKIRFEGKNESHYNFFIDLGTLNLKWPVYRGNLDKYKKDCQLIFNQENAFLNKYISKNPIVSDDFKTLVKDRLYFEYLNHLLILRKNKDVVVLTKKLIAEYKKKEKNFNISNYFDNITVKQFNRPELLSVDSFYGTLPYYIRYYFVNSNYTAYSKERFIQEKDFILNNFNGDVQRFAIFKQIIDYFSKNPSENSDNIIALINDCKHNFSNPQRIKKIENIERSLSILNKPFNAEVLNSKLINLKGDTLKFNTILKNLGHKIKAIDFWASWCAPCVSEIIKGNLYRTKLTKEDGVAWIYLSIDKDKNKWIKKSKSLAKYGTLKNQYLILDSKKSPLIQFLDIKSIPRYVILDKKNILVRKFAPRPSEGLIFKKIIDKINLK